MPVGDDLEFQTRYRILRCTSSNSRFRTHAALEQRTGRAVMVHMVDSADPETIERIREQVQSLPPEEARHVLELTELPSSFAVVTEFIQGLAFFSEWLDEKSPAKPLPAADQARTNAERDRANESADLAPTVIIKSPVAPPKPATDSANSAAPTVVRPAVKISAAPPEPPPPEPLAPAPLPVAPPASKSADRPEPGDYTRIFKLGGTPAANAPAANQPPPTPFTPTAVSTGPATAPSHSPAALPDSSPTPPPAPEIAEAKPGEYTQIFGARSAPPPARTPQQSSPSPFGDVGNNLSTPSASERASSGGGATGTFGAWGDPSPSPSSDFGFGRSDAGSKLPPSSFPPLPPSPPTPSSLPTSMPAASSPSPTPPIPSTPFGGAAIPSAGLSPLLQGPSANLPTPPSPPSLSSRSDDLVQRSTPGLSPLPAIQPPAFGGGLPPLQSLGDSLDSPFAQRGPAKAAGGYTQINKSVTPAPPPAIAAPAKVVTPRREGFRAPTALVIVIAVVVVLAITLILYFALRAPVRPLVVPAANGAASSAPASASPQTTPAGTPTSAPTTPPQKNP